MIVIAGFLTAMVTAYFVTLVLAYRIVMFDAYARYRKSALVSGTPYGWVRFFLGYQMKPLKSRDDFGEITFLRFLMIAFLALAPLAFVASAYL